MRTTVPNIAKASDTSDPFTLSFLVTFLMYVLPQSIYHNGPNKSNRLSLSYLPLHLLMHRASFESYITCWVPHSSPTSTINFPLSQLIPKTQNIKGNPRNQQEENHRKPTIIQHYKQSGITMHHTHAKSQIKHNHHKRPKAQD